MRNRRKIIVNMIESGCVNNARLAEYFANKFKERGCQENAILPVDR